jgi:hypothetical protein
MPGALDRWLAVESDEENAIMHSIEAGYANGNFGSLREALNSVKAELRQIMLAWSLF